MQLREHGDLGLGTFDGLDGEMVIVDGHFFQVRSDGLVREVDEPLRPYHEQRKKENEFKSKSGRPQHTHNSIEK